MCRPGDYATSARGFSFLELLCVVAIVVTLAGMAIPLGAQALEEGRVSGAARYLSGRLFWIRMEAVKRSAYTGLRFERQGNDVGFSIYVDGNRNGILSRDIANGTDSRLGAPERLSSLFPRVDFAILPNTAPIEPGDVLEPGGDPIRFGRSDIVSFSPDGTGTSGTLYIGGRRSQLAVRVLGATGRIRTLRFDFGTRRWIDP